MNLAGLCYCLIAKLTGNHPLLLSACAVRVLSETRLTKGAIRYDLDGHQTFASLRPCQQRQAAVRHVSDRTYALFILLPRV